MCCACKISASRRALDWNSPMSAPQSNLSSSTIGQQHHPIRTGSPATWSFRQGQHVLAHVITANVLAFRCFPHSLRFENFQDIKRARNKTIQPSKHQAIDALEGRSFGRFAT